MAEPLKNLYTDEWVKNLGQELQENSSAFNLKSFTQSILNDDWENRELKDRTNHIARMMECHITGGYEEQIDLLRKVAPQFTGLTALVFPTFVELFGLDYYQVSITALAEFTQYSTAEFAIRPFIVQHPETMQQMLKWSLDENYHIRRLASEGCRPLLPWAMKLKEFEKDPSPILPILENLRNDPEDYVYRSVANNLNDISKNHPNMVLDLCEKWINESKTTQWVCKHALRTLLKKGNQRAMKLFGFGSIEAIEVVNFILKDEQIPIGSATEFSLEIINKGTTKKFRLEYAIGYLKKAGHHNEKVFQIKEIILKQKESLTIYKKLSFIDLTTRKHYKGRHYIQLIINGQKVAKKLFELT